MTIISTSKGIMSDKMARRENVGERPFVMFGKGAKIRCQE